MLNIHGRLVVETKFGRNDSFNLARVCTSVGDFICMNSFIQQLDEGEVSGTITIESISLKTRISGNTAYTDIRAEVVNFVPDVETEDDLPEEPEISDDLTGQFESYGDLDQSDETDTSGSASEEQFDESDHTGTEATFEAETSPDMTTDDHPSLPEENEEDEELFGVNYPLGRIVQIDSTVARLKIMKQVNRLKELGYQFDVKAQTWQL